MKSASPVVALTVIALTNSFPARIAAILIYGLRNNISDKVIKGVLGPQKLDAYSAAKMAPGND